MAPGFVSSPGFQTLKKLIGWLTIIITSAAAISALTAAPSIPVGVYLLFVAIFVILMHMKAWVQARSMFHYPTNYDGHYKDVTFPFVLCSSNSFLFGSGHWFRQENLIARCGNLVFMLDGIKLGIMYILLSIPTFIPGFTSLFAVFAGVVILLFGICFVLQHFAPPSTESTLPTSIPPGTQYPPTGY